MIASTLRRALVLVVGFGMVPFTQARNSRRIGRRTGWPFLLTG